MKVLIGGAWIYANGSMHIGHLAALLPSDVIARYYRLKGEDVCFVSGSDCYGTPIAIRAKQEGITPFEISKKYHKEFVINFKYLGFSFNYYGKTIATEHSNFVQSFHKELYNSDKIYEKEVPQAYCENCKQFLPDRFIIGTCPNCGKLAKGDQCDSCGNVYQPEELINIYCSQCNSKPTFKPTKHLYIAISKIEKELVELLNKSKGWRNNAKLFTKRYIDEGLRDRAITRDLDWGIAVPKDNYEEKKIYIWAENVLGYLSTCNEYCKKNGYDFDDFWNSNSRHYYVHGKDNIPFHTIILPSLLIVQNKDLHLPDYIISSEYMTLEGRKISTSENYAIWIKDLIGKYNPDAIRYYFIKNAPEKRDSDFSWEEFYHTNNSELLGSYGNFINRTLVFINKSFDGKVPQGSIDFHIKDELNQLYKNIATLIENGELKHGLKTIFDFIRKANKYFNDEKPWITIKSEKSICMNTMYNCVQIIANLAVLLEPFLPFSSDKVIKWFELERKWEFQEVPINYSLKEIDILFERIDKKIIQEEIRKLSNIKYNITEPPN